MSHLRITPSHVDLGESLPASGGLEEGVVVTFASGLPGFDYFRQFVIEPLGPELAPFCRLRAVEPAGVEFIVVPPGLIFPDYVVEIDEEGVDRLELEADEAVILAIVTVSDDGRAPTANLLGPIVINRRTKAAAQLVQLGSGYEAAEPLVPASAA